MALEEAIYKTVHSLLKLSTRGKMLPNNTDIHARRNMWKKAGKMKTGNVIKSIFAYYFF